MEVPRTFLKISFKFYSKRIFEHIKPLGMSMEREQRVAKRYPVNSLYSITKPGELPSVWLFSFVYVRHICFASNLPILLLPREQAWVHKEAFSFSFLYHLLFSAGEYGGASLVWKHLGPRWSLLASSVGTGLTQQAYQWYLDTATGRNARRNEVETGGSERKVKRSLDKSQACDWSIKH